MGQSELVDEGRFGWRLQCDFPTGQSSDAYLVRIHFLDQETKRITESAMMQIGFRNSEAKESDLTTMAVDTTLFSERHEASKIGVESSKVELAVRLSR